MGAKQPLKPVAEQVVVIAGASSGIGRQAALMFAKEGARVVIAARDEAALHDLESEIRRGGGQALAVTADVTDRGQLEYVATRAAEWFGRIDTWVQMAGVAAYGTFDQLSDEEFRRVMEVNFFGAVNGARAALPHLKREDRGALIFVGSALSDRAVPLQSAYCASKAALKGFVESLRCELMDEGSELQVTLVKPSSMNTPLFDQALTKMGYKPKPMSPVYSPKIAAAVVVHCAAHRERDVVAGGGGKLLTTMEAFGGPLLDWYAEKTAIKGQQSKEPKEASAGNNLWAPMDGMGRVDGSFRGRRFSVYTWLRGKTRLAAGMGAAGVASRLARARANGRARDHASQAG